MSPDDTNVNPTPTDPMTAGEPAVVPGGETMSTEEANAVDAAMAGMPAIPGEEGIVGEGEPVTVLATDAVAANEAASEVPAKNPIEESMGAAEGTGVEASVLEGAETAIGAESAPEIDAIETSDISMAGAETPATPEVADPETETAATAPSTTPIVAAGVGGVADFTKEDAAIVTPVAPAAAAKPSSKKTMIILIAVVGVLIVGAVAIFLLTM